MTKNLLVFCGVLSQTQSFQGQGYFAVPLTICIVLMMFLKVLLYVVYACYETILQLNSVVLYITQIQKNTAYSPLQISVTDGNLQHSQTGL